MLTMTFTCYVDEAGCPGKLPAADAPIQPFLIVAAVALRSADVTTFTRQFNALKSRHRLGPGQHPTTPEDLVNELKGVTLRTGLRSDRGGGNPAYRTLDELLEMLERFGARLFGQVVPKPPGEKFDGRSAYAGAMQHVARAFHGFLETQCAEGLMLADFREPKLNAQMTERICQAKFNARDELPRLLDAPVFGHSQSHAGLQAADWIASALLFPCASTRHAAELAGHPHLHEDDGRIAARYRKWLRKLLGPVDEPTVASAPFAYSLHGLLDQTWPKQAQSDRQAGRRNKEILPVGVGHEVTAGRG